MAITIRTVQDAELYKEAGVRNALSFLKNGEDPAALDASAIRCAIDSLMGALERIAIGEALATLEREKDQEALDAAMAQIQWEGDEG